MVEAKTQPARNSGSGGKNGNSRGMFPDKPKPEPHISEKQRVFIDEYLKDMNATRAAKAAGYKGVAMGGKLLSPKVYPLIAQAVAEGLKEKNKRAKLSSDEVLEYIHTAMTFEPLKWFMASEDGGYCISEEKLANLPPHIGCLIESVESKKTVRRSEDSEETEVILKVKVVSKTAMATIAAKHQLGEKLNVQGVMNHINWDAMIHRTPPNAHDPIEEKIKTAEQGKLQ